VRKCRLDIKFPRAVESARPPEIVFIAEIRKGRGAIERPGALRKGTLSRLTNPCSALSGHTMREVLKKLKANPAGCLLCS
jgi:hypothetical protein